MTDDGTADGEYANVVDISAAKPRITAIARCLDCGNDWMAVAQTEDPWLECPACSLRRGRIINAFELAGSFFQCNCGNDLFTVHPDGVFCPNCAAEISYHELGESDPEWSA